MDALYGQTRGTSRKIYGLIPDQSARNYYNNFSLSNIFIFFVIKAIDLTFIAYLKNKNQEMMLK